MQEWVGALLAPAGILCRLWLGKVLKRADSPIWLQTVLANAALIPTGYGLFLLASLFWNGSPTATADMGQNSSLTLSFTLSLLILGISFSSGILFNCNKK